MRKCSNCRTEITCGCQDRTASNGAIVCQNCIALYEQQLINQTQHQTQHYSSNPDENIPTP